MPRNGVGTYVLPAGQPVVPNTTISSSIFNTLTTDLSNALTTSICTDGQTPMAANLPMGNNRITGLAAGSGSNDAVNIGQLASGGATLIGGNAQIVGSVTALRALLKTSPSKYAATTGYYANGDGGDGLYYLDVADTTSADNGGTIIVASDGGRWKLQLGNPVTVRQFGAKGDGATDDTAAIQACLNYVIANNKSVYFPAGTYIVSGLTYSSSSAHSEIYGDGSGATIIRNNINTSPVIIFNGSPNQINVCGINFSGNGSVRSWGNGNGVAGNSLVGTIPTSACAVRMVDMTHAVFHDCYFTDAIWGADIQGGISVTLTSCYAYWNAQVGYRIYRNGTSSGWPNVITLRDSSAVENGQVGVYFDDGRQLVIQGGHYEGNGKNTVQAPGVACGVFIGSNTGIENGATNGPNSTPFHTMAASISDVWFEQNGNNNGSGVPNGASMAHIVHQHGELVIGGRCIFTNSTAGRNIRINGGQYKIEDCSFESNLTVSTNYIDEGGTSGVANLISGNYINRCTFGSAGAKLTAANCTVDQSKTYFDYSRYAPTKTISGLGTTSSGTFTVTWPAGTWQTTPNVVAQVYTNDSGTTTYSAEVYGVSTTGFTVRAKQNAAGVVTQPAITAMWIANGT